MFETNRIESQSVGISNIDYSIYVDQAKILQPYLTKEYAQVLDYGAGNSPYRELIKCRSFTAADITQNIKGTVDVIIAGDSTLPGVEDNTFDLILCMDVLEHIENDAAAVCELFRVLSDDGMLIVTVPFIYREHEYPFDFRRYTSVGISSRLKQAGFSSIEVYKVANIWQVLVATWFKGRILNGEIDGRNFFNKISRKLAGLMLIPIFNLTIFRFPIESNAGIFGRLTVIAKK